VGLSPPRLSPWTNHCWLRKCESRDYAPRSEQKGTVLTAVSSTEWTECTFHSGGYIGTECTFHCVTGGFIGTECTFHCVTGGFIGQSTRSTVLLEVTLDRVHVPLCYRRFHRDRVHVPLCYKVGPGRRRLISLACLHGNDGRPAWR